MVSSRCTSLIQPSDLRNKTVDRNEDNQLIDKEDVFELELTVKKDLLYKPTIKVLRSLIH